MQIFQKRFTDLVADAFRTAASLLSSGFKWFTARKIDFVWNAPIGLAAYRATKLRRLNAVNSLRRGEPGLRHEDYTCPSARALRGSSAMCPRPSSALGLGKNDLAQNGSHEFLAGYSLSLFWAMAVLDQFLHRKLQMESRGSVALFSDCGQPKNYASNVEIVPISFAEYKTLVSDRLCIVFNPTNPFKLCDLRPCLGWLHER